MRGSLRKLTSGWKTCALQEAQLLTAAAEATSSQETEWTRVGVKCRGNGNQSTVFFSHFTLYITTNTKRDRLLSKNTTSTLKLT